MSCDLSVVCCVGVVLCCEVLCTNIKKISWRLRKMNVVIPRKQLLCFKIFICLFFHKKILGREQE